MALKECKLGDLIDVTRGQSLPGEFYSTEGEFIRLTCGNFDYVNNSFKENKSKEDLYYVGKIKPEFIMKKGDIITPLTEQAIGLLGSTAIIPESDKYIQSQDVAKIICKEGKIDHDFAYYLIPSKCVKEQLSAAAQQTKIRHTSPDAIKNCKVFVPSLSEQKKIAAVLSALDEKIALNKKMNQKLEAMAKRLYDYWFVQFDFPDEKGRPYKTSGGKMEYNPILKREIPEGWEVGSFGDCIQLVSNRVDPRDVKKDDFYTPIEVIPKHQMSLDECAPIEDATSGLCSYDKKNILLSNRRVYFHKVCIAPFPGLTRDTVIIFKPKITENLGFVYQVVDSDHFIEYATVNSYGSEQPVLSWPTVQDYKIVRPPQKMMLEYSERVKDIIDHVLNIQLENMKLKKMRDKLLPLLMNGQVEVD